jgi:hypothetical protein
MRMRLGRHAACMRTKSYTYRILVRKPEGKRPLRKRRRSLEENIKMGFREMGWAGINLINLTQLGQLESCCENGSELSVSIECWKVLEYLSDWVLLQKD